MNEIMSLGVEQDEAEAAARLLEVRARRALEQAPDLVAHIRSLGISGRSERGETLPEWSAPMRLSPTDDADSVYAQLLNWVSYWSEELEVDPPSAAAVAWANDREVQGFRAGTTAEGAALLVRLQTMWLLLRMDAIAGHASAGVFHEDVSRLLWEVRSRYPVAPRPERPASPRPCPVCGDAAVTAEWVGEGPRDVEVRCGRCGFEVPARSVARIVDWVV